RTSSVYEILCTPLLSISTILFKNSLLRYAQRPNTFRRQPIQFEAARKVIDLGEPEGEGPLTTVCDEFTKRVDSFNWRNIGNDFSNGQRQAAEGRRRSRRHCSGCSGRRSG